MEDRSEHPQMDATDIVAALARIEEAQHGTNLRLDKINGSVGDHDKRIGKIETKCAAHEAMSIIQARDSIADDAKKKTLETRLEELEHEGIRARGKWQGIALIVSAGSASAVFLKDVLIALFSK